MLQISHLIFPCRTNVLYLQEIIFQIILFYIVDIYILYLDFFNLLVILTLIVYPVENSIAHPPTSSLEKTIIHPPTSPTAEIMDPEDIKLLQAIKAIGNGYTTKNRLATGL